MAGSRRFDCPICRDERSLIVGLSVPPRRTTKIKWEREPCPACQPGPHGSFAEEKARHLGWSEKKRA